MTQIQVKGLLLPPIYSCSHSYHFHALSWPQLAYVFTLEGVSPNGLSYLS